MTPDNKYQAAARRQFLHAFQGELRELDAKHPFMCKIVVETAVHRGRIEEVANQLGITCNEVVDGWQAALHLLKGADSPLFTVLAAINDIFLYEKNGHDHGQNGMLLQELREAALRDFNENEIKAALNELREGGGRDLAEVIREIEIDMEHCERIIT